MEKLKAEHVTKYYHGEKVIDDVSVTLNEHELVCLLGVSGSGKTTLFNILSGLQRPEEGAVFLNQKEITGEAGHISYMLQKDLLMPYRTVLKNVALPLLIRGIPQKQALAEAAQHFEEFGLAGTENQYPSQLSGGMRQRAALLRTYMFSQDVALLDEPFSALDTITKSNIHNWYLDVMSKIQLSTLFITHDIDEAILLSDRIYIMTGRPGRIVGEMTIDSPKPRAKDFNLTDQFITYKKKIIEILNL